MNEKSEGSDLSLNEIVGRIIDLEEWKERINKALRARADGLATDDYFRRVIISEGLGVEDVDPEVSEVIARKHDIEAEQRGEPAFDAFGLKAAMIDSSRQAQRALIAVDRRERRKAWRRLHLRYRDYFVKTLPDGSDAVQYLGELVDWFFLKTLHHGHRLSIINAVIAQGELMVDVQFSFEKDDFYDGWGQVLDFLRKHKDVGLAFYRELEACRRAGEKRVSEDDGAILETSRKVLVGRLSGMADSLGDGSWRTWTDEQAREVVAALDLAREGLKPTKKD